jgi:cytochrome bd-type quinol oxidase subunit 1
MRSIALALILLLPDRLPSLVVLVGFWIPPAVAGWVAAASLQRSHNRSRAKVIYAVLAIFVLGYAAAWFFFNLGRMPPYIPGATTDPTFASPKAIAGLAVVASALVLPGSALACVLAFRSRVRFLRSTSASSGTESLAERSR